MCRRQAFSNALRSYQGAILFRRAFICAFARKFARARIRKFAHIDTEVEMYQALYRSQRPEVFSEVLGQEHIVKILKNQVAQDKVGHAYLFCGTRGTGKTTMARIMAKAVNCTGDAADGRPCGVCPNCRSIQEGTFIDMIEIDAASNNGVENVGVRQLSAGCRKAQGIYNRRSSHVIRARLQRAT